MGKWQFGSWQQRVRQYAPARGVLLALVVSAFGLAGLRLSHAEELTPTPAVKPVVPSKVSAVAGIENRVIVRYKPDADLTDLQGRIAHLRSSEKQDIKNLRMKVLDVQPGTRQQVIDSLKADPQVEYAEPVLPGEIATTTPNDPYFKYQGADQSVLADLLWDKAKGSSNVIIADIDTGYTPTHPDMAGKFVAGYDFVNNDNDPTDDQGHGTMTAGVLAANTNNGVGIAGLCWSCRIMPIKVIDAAGKTNTEIVASGIRYAADHGASVINMSLAGQGTSATLESAMQYALSKNVVMVSAAGNDGTGTPYWPTVYDETIGVSGTNGNDQLDPDSNYGQHIDVAAPFVGAATTMDGAYAQSFAGTSHATPVVAGIIGVLRAAFPNATAAQVRNAITSTADPCCSGNINGGRVNAIKAYNLLAGAQNVDTTKPTLTVVSPANGATISGSSVKFVATAHDNVAIAKVHMQLDRFDPTVGAGDTGQYFYTWNTTGATAGTHTITFTAYDAAGNSTVVTRTYNVDNTNPDTTPPSVNVTSPAEGATVSGAAVTFTATASDASGIAFVEFWDGSQFISRNISSPYQYVMNSTAMADGPKTITVKAYDIDGNVTQVNRTVTIKNATTPPTPPTTPPPTTPPPTTPPPTTPPVTPGKPGDLNGDNKVNITDLSMLLSAWNSSNAKADINGSGKVDIIDLSILLSHWG